MRAPSFWAKGGVVPAVLAPAAWAYDLAGRIMRASTRPYRAAVPVICVGNIVAGGAGKTPVALAIARRLSEMRRHPHFLTRGYGGRSTGPLRVERARHDAREVGDEPLLLARVAPTWVARDRPAGARAAVAAGADIVVMDDGLQNESLAKDLSLVVIDGGYGFGNGLVMPAGPLRETVASGLARAAAVVLVGEDTSGAERTIAGRKPVLRARLIPGAGAENLLDRDVVAFAGIGRPEKFFATLSEMGARVVATRSFADHHFYSADEIMRLIDVATAREALVVTTEKDAVRLPPEARPMVQVLAVELEWEAPDQIDALLARLA
jgi:tetraacyldisaccharide 4'-kinase